MSAAVSDLAMKMSKVGNQTNSQDPQAVNSRVFVGNLNTFQCSKTDVERMFQRYGRIAGISMHKGYAFVQFTNPFDARSACLGEDARTVLGQVLDVNLVAEPKPHQTGRKRQNLTKTGNDWDYYYDSYYASAAFPAPRLAPPLKRPRLVAPPPPRPAAATAAKMAAAAAAAAAALHSACAAANDIKTYSNPDILICGNCREMFTELQELLAHKKTYCKLRFTCKCHAVNGLKMKEGTALLCSQCKDSFHSAWDLMVHVQAAHMLNIYQLGVAKVNGTTKHEEHEQRNGEMYASSGMTQEVSESPGDISEGIDSDAAATGDGDLHTANGVAETIVSASGLLSGLSQRHEALMCAEEAVRALMQSKERLKRPT